MVLRRDGDGVLAVGQAAHAWLCGQLARAWGGPGFGPEPPDEAVALGAEQHDVGMAWSDLHPGRNPGTGLPYWFTELAVADSLALWSAGPRRLITQSRYAALLAARHGRRLYERRDLATLPEPDAELVRRFLRESRELEDALAASPRADPERLARDSQLVWTWDTLSLALLLDWAPLTLHDVPAADGDAFDIAVTAGDPATTLDPWPFSAERVQVRCEGRRLTSTYPTDAALADALQRAPWETVGFALAPSPVAPPGFPRAR